MSRFLISPHPEAPTLSKACDAQLILAQLEAEAQSPNFQATQTVRKLFREAGLVSLFFFLKGIAAFSCPFELLNTGLNREMCNFRQMWLRPGGHFATFLPRFHRKSTIFTVGGSAWEIVRNPNIKIRLMNAVVEKVEEFAQLIERIFDSNDLFAWVYPEFVPPANMTGWNNRGMVVPNRTRQAKEPTIKVGGVEGTSESDHHDLLIIDDPVSRKCLDAIGKSNIEMYKTTKWFWWAIKTLVVDWVSSRVGVIGTRYALDDTYEGIMKDLKRFYGYRRVLDIGGYEESPGGTWEVYYRLIREEGKIICPEAVTEKVLTKMAEEDPWTYWTNMMNLPQDAGLTDFAKFKIKYCRVACENDGWFVCVDDPDASSRSSERDSSEKSEKKIPFSSLSIMIGIDPAATEKYVSSRTSTSALAVVGRDRDGIDYGIWMQSGYVSLMVLFDWIFDAVKKFGGYVEKVVFERAAFQKILKPLAEEERFRRGIWVAFDDVTPVGDKDARIRAGLGSVLERGEFYINENCATDFVSQVKGFPQSHMKDLLDATVIALNAVGTPDAEDDQRAVSSQFEKFKNRKVNYAGW